MWQQLLELFEKADRPIKICEGDYTRVAADYPIRVSFNILFYSL